MRKYLLAAAALGILLISPVLSGDVKFGDYTLTGPLDCKNLSIFVIRGQDTMDTGKIITLEEGLKKKLVIVIETGDVNRLEIQNISGDLSIFIQAGDIVKGGKQDRTLGYDIIIKPRAKVKIDSFCVEQSRWTQRGKEDVSKFEESGKQVTGNEMKLAVRKAKEQGKVWESVRMLKEEAKKEMAFDLADSRSASSLQLALENKELQKLLQEYRDNLLGKISGVKDALGMVVVYNNTVMSADIYASHKLFTEILNKSFDSAATEAIISGGKKENKLTADFAAGWLSANGGKEEVKALENGLELSVKDSKNKSTFETRTQDDKKILRKNFLNTTK